MIEIDLPYPPSVNTYWRHFKNRVILSEKGRIYKRKVESLVKDFSPFQCKLSITILIFPPDKRKRDIDNTLKAILDAIAPHVYLDDSQIVELHVYKNEIIKNGKIKLMVMQCNKDKS